jgi:hypothetical protein
MRGPIIVMGMHRSGTTLLVNILESLGVFMGANYGINKEAFCYLRRNEWILQSIGGAWDHVSPLEYLYESEGLENDLISALKKDLASLRYREYRSKTHKLWGWKDPRNLVLWPFWRRIYPDAKFIFIVRNGVDVALSLQSRALRNLDRGITPFTATPLTRKLKAAWNGVETYSLQSARCLNLMAGYKLWEEYNEYLGIEGGIEAESILIVKYEDLLEEAGVLNQLIGFIGADVPEKALRNIRNDFSKESISSYTRVPAAANLYQQVKNRKLMKFWEY